MMFIAVDLPEPDGPMMATNSPRPIDEVDAGQRVHLRLALAVGLPDLVEGDQRAHRRLSSAPAAIRR